MSIFLCIDSALGAGSVALYRDGELLKYQHIAEKGMQVRYLVTTVQACLESQGIVAADLDRIYCTVGPGGFTGIRIGLAAAQAYGFTLDIPVIGVSTLACLAAQGQVEAMIPAGRGKAYRQCFDETTLAPLGDIELVEVDGAVPMPEINATTIGSLVLHESFEVHHTRPADPLYIRPPDAKLPQSKPSKKA